MLPREFTRRVKAHRERVEFEVDTAWAVGLYLRNNLVQALAGKKKVKPHTLEMMKRKPPPDTGREAFAALLTKIQKIRDTGTRRVLH